MIVYITMLILFISYMNSTFASEWIDRLVHFLLSFSVPGIDEDLLIEFNDSGLSRSIAMS